MLPDMEPDGKRLWKRWRDPRRLYDHRWRTLECQNTTSSTVSPSFLCVPSAFARESPAPAVRIILRSRQAPNNGSLTNPSPNNLPAASETETDTCRSRPLRKMRTLPAPLPYLQAHPGRGRFAAWKNLPHSGPGQPSGSKPQPSPPSGALSGLPGM